MSVRVLLAVAVAVVGVLASTGCTATVDGQGRLAPEALVQPTATPSPPSLPSPTPSGIPAPRPTGSSAAGPGMVPAAYAGTWRGVMSQPRGTIRTWTAILVLPGGRRDGRFLIEGICSGTTAVLSAGDAALVLRETIQQDPTNRCAAAGTITLTRAGGGRLRMSWVDAATPDNVASGTVARS